MSARVSDQRVAPTETVEDGAAMFMSELLSETQVRGTTGDSRGPGTGMPASRRTLSARCVPKMGCRLRCPRERPQKRCFSANFRGKKICLPVTQADLGPRRWGRNAPGGGANRPTPWSP
jgi:hypothetical protein